MPSSYFTVYNKLDTCSSCNQYSYTRKHKDLRLCSTCFSELYKSLAQKKKEINIPNDILTTEHIYGKVNE